MSQNNDKIIERNKIKSNSNIITIINVDDDIIEIIPNKTRIDNKRKINLTLFIINKIDSEPIILDNMCFNLTDKIIQIKKIIFDKCNINIKHQNLKYVR